MRLALILAAALTALLVLTNPGPERFEAFVQQEVARYVAAQHLPGGGLLGQLGGQLAGRLVRERTERRNYLLVSVYTLDLDGPQRQGQEWRFLGIAGQFVELERPEALGRAR